MALLLIEKLCRSIYRVCPPLNSDRPSITTPPLSSAICLRLKPIAIRDDENILFWRDLYILEEELYLLEEKYITRFQL